MVVPFSCHSVTEYSCRQPHKCVCGFFFKWEVRFFFLILIFKKLFKSPLDFVNRCYLWNFKIFHKDFKS